MPKIPSSQESLYHLKGHMTSAYPGYEGTFLACVRAKTIRQAKSRFERIVHDEYPARGPEAGLVAPIIHFESVKPVGENKVCWGVFTHLKERK